ncbi:MAG: zf-HC2 domain-containing protein [Acidobacteriota bacterium]
MASDALNEWNSPPVFKRLLSGKPLKTEKEYVVMICNDFQLMASAYLDEELTAPETEHFHAHTAFCSACREHLEEIKQTSLLLKQTPTPEVPRELRGYVMNAIVGRVNHDISFFQRLTEWLLKMNPRPFSIATGSVVTVILFAFLMTGFKPIPVPHEQLEELDQTASFIYPIVGSAKEYFSYNNLQQDKDLTDASALFAIPPPPPPVFGLDYELPRLNTDPMVSFSHIAYQKPGNEDMSALVEVDPNGRARLVNVFNEPKDPAVIEQLWWSLTNNSFKPAKVEGQPVTTHIVLLFEKMDVRG